MTYECRGAWRGVGVERGQGAVLMLMQDDRLLHEVVLVPQDRQPERKEAEEPDCPVSLFLPSPDSGV